MRLILLAVPVFAIGAALIGLEACSAKFVSCDNANSCFPADANFEDDAGSFDDGGWWQTDSATDPRDVTSEVSDAGDAEGG